jgi:hypothetical protein
VVVDEGPGNHEAVENLVAVKLETNLETFYKYGCCETENKKKIFSFYKPRDLI